MMKDKMISARGLVHKATAEMVALRLPFEEMVFILSLNIISYIRHGSCKVEYQN